MTIASVNKFRDYTIIREPVAAEASDAIQYYGYMRKTGWCIARRNTTTGVWTFAVGNDNANIDSIWTAKATQTYAEYYLVF